MLRGKPIIMLCALLAVSQSAFASVTKTRTFEFRYDIFLKEVPADASDVKTLTIQGRSGDRNRGWPGRAVGGWLCHHPAPRRHRVRPTVAPAFPSPGGGGYSERFSYGRFG